MKKQLEDFLALADKATPGPWEPCLGSGINECTALHFPGDEIHPSGLFVCDLVPDWAIKYEEDLKYKATNMEFIAASRTMAPKMARALLKAVEGINKELEAMGEDNCSCGAEEQMGEGYTDVVCYLHETLSEIEEILK